MLQQRDQQIAGGPREEGMRERSRVAGMKRAAERKTERKLLPAGAWAMVKMGEGAWRPMRYSGQVLGAVTWCVPGGGAAIVAAIAQ